MLAIGIDIGSLTTKAVVMNDGQLLASEVSNTLDEADASASVAMTKALEKAGADDNPEKYVITTGNGGKEVSFADGSKAITTCLARGIYWYAPDTRAVIDIGAESSSVVKINNRGRVIDWANHDKCASGTGLFLQQMAKLMKLSFEEMSELSRRAEKGAEITGTCAVFAESEVISHVHRVPPTPLPEIILGIYLSVSTRIKTMCKRIGAGECLAVSGGVALHAGLVETLEKELKQRIYVPQNPVCVAAMGAAVLAGEEIKKELQQ
ncbi:MAG: acyl-CoA dehydratase activase [Dehalococcoidales bacterium]|jgi:predicted CoA-substrate-specific enzyme activase|nr:acyl-CoA dehydratase activase [Dehalococcoidales bacterium]MDX9985832.1 acyl-CoA dehydratase activase [Dehalococcoidales bacterium]